MQRHSDVPGVRTEHGALKVPMPFLLVCRILRACANPVPTRRHRAAAGALAFLIAWPAAQALPVHAPVPGGIAVIELPEDAAEARVLYRGRPVLTVQENGRRYALVGLPLSAKPGPDSLSLRDSSPRERVVDFRIEDKAYPTQRLTIKDKRKVNPLPEDVSRIARELKTMEAAYATFTPEPVSIVFDPPVAGIASNSFGSRRIFNGEARNPHSGMDIAAPAGTPIVAPAPGTVVLTGDFFFNGQSVFIDHGQGLITMYCHMSRVDVRKGQRVGRGEMLGTVGSTGRVTGPHLHWTVSLNDARIDPALFVDTGRFPPLPKETAQAKGPKLDPANHAGSE